MCGRDRSSDGISHRGLFYPCHMSHVRFGREAPGSSEAEKSFDQSLVSVLEFLIEPTIDKWINGGVRVR